MINAKIAPTSKPLDIVFRATTSEESRESTFVRLQNYKRSSLPLSLILRSPIGKVPPK
jgi:hypothetical protein